MMQIAQLNLQTVMPLCCYDLTNSICSTDTISLQATMLLFMIMLLS